MIHVFYSKSLPDERLMTEHKNVLALDELDQAEKFTRPIDRRRFLWRRIFRRKVLGSVLDVCPRNISFSMVCSFCGQKEHGKPKIVDTEALEFSASQTSDISVLAYGDRPLGVDVQQLVDDESAVKSVALTDREVALIPPDKVNARKWLTLMWARKEAVLKAEGCGLIVEPNSIEAICDNIETGQFSSVDAPSMSSTWQVASFFLGDGDRTAIAVSTNKNCEINVAEFKLF